MANVEAIKGIKKAKDRLSRLAVSKQSAFGRGLVRAGLLLQRESQKIVPIDTANLKNSAFTRASQEGTEITVEIGYTAAYALYVHENLDARHKPGKQAKFLEQPAREQRPQMRRLVLDELEGEA